MRVKEGYCMKGKKYLKVTGILLSIGGILGVIVYRLLDLILGMGFVFDMSAGGIEVIALGAFDLALVRIPINRWSLWCEVL